MFYANYKVFRFKITPEPSVPHVAFFYGINSSTAALNSDNVASESIRFMTWDENSLSKLPPKKQTESQNVSESHEPHCRAKVRKTNLDELI